MFLPSCLSLSDAVSRAHCRRQNRHARLNCRCFPHDRYYHQDVDRLNCCDYRDHLLRCSPRGRH